MKWLLLTSISRSDRAYAVFMVHPASSETLLSLYHKLREDFLTLNLLQTSFSKEQNKIYTFCQHWCGEKRRTH